MWKVLTQFRDFLSNLNCRSKCSNCCIETYVCEVCKVPSAKKLCNKCEPKKEIKNIQNIDSPYIENYIKSETKKTSN